tara:strand:+ start:137 stop:868 length:732 start_codon:yes stop_codon:yes gene_type:complete
MFKDWLTNFIATYDFSPLSRDGDGYFKGITKPDSNYWDVHTRGLEVAGIDTMDKETTEILDIGTWFGILPYALKEYGFKHVDTTECAAHSTAFRDYFENQCWHHFGLTPTELHIKSRQEFELPKQYDLIMLFRSNLFWKTDKLLHHTKGNTIENGTWMVTDKDSVDHFFFTVYDKQDWELFIENIKRYLKPGGKAVIQPSPFVYDLIDGYNEEREFLAPYTHEGPVYDVDSNHRAYYILVENN